MTEPPAFTSHYAQTRYSWVRQHRTPDCMICKTYLRYVEHPRNRRDNYPVLNYLAGTDSGEHIIANGHFPIAHEIHAQSPDRLAFNNRHLTDDEWLARQRDPQDVVFRTTWLPPAVINRYYRGILDVEIAPDEPLTKPGHRETIFDNPAGGTPQRVRREDRGRIATRLKQFQRKKELDMAIRMYAMRATDTSDC